jgi:DNA primase
MTQAPYREAQQRHPPIDVKRLKESIRLSDVAGQFTRLRPSGRSRIGLCPIHDEKTASFVVTDDIGQFYCHGCQASGDAIDLVRAVKGFDFLETVKYLAGEIPRVSVARERERAKKLDQAKRAIAGAYARTQWKEAVPGEKTPAETYLRRRGITCAIPKSLRFGIVPPWIDLTTGKKARPLPALIAACQGADGRVTGVQRIFLQPNGLKALLPRPKLNLGLIRGGSLRLAAEAAEMIVCEGPEDGLTLQQMLPSTPVWVALGSGNLSRMELPPGVRRVLVAGDNNAAGRKAAQDACEAFRSQGRQATTIFPDAAYEDFNDQLRGIPMQKKRAEIG